MRVKSKAIFQLAISVYITAELGKKSTPLSFFGTWTSEFNFISVLFFGRCMCNDSVLTSKVSVNCFFNLLNNSYFSWENDIVWYHKITAFKTELVPWYCVLTNGLKFTLEGSELFPFTFRTEVFLLCLESVIPVLGCDLLLFTVL